MRRCRGGLLGSQGLLGGAVLPGPPPLPLGRFERRRHRGGHGVGVHHVGPIGGVGIRQEAIGW